MNLLQIITRLIKPINWNERLATDVKRRRESFAILDYKRRRAAALRGLGRA